MQIRSDSVDGRAIIEIAVSQLSIMFESEREVADADILTLRNLVRDIVEAVVDAVGYLEGIGYRIEVTSILYPDNKLLVFGVDFPAIRSAKENRPLGVNDLVTNVVIGRNDDTADRRFHRASLHNCLADLREAIHSVRNGPFLCYRAVETLMQGFRSPQGQGTEADGWVALRGSLLLSEDSLRQLASRASRARHGNYGGVTEAEHVAVMEFTWKIVDRFVLYASGGFQALDESAHEELKM